MNKLLKAAKAALDRKEYESVLQHCQNVLNKDASNYNGHVFAGLASLQLGHHDDAKRHYKTAIDAQPDNPLAWKGLGDFYDKHRPVVQDEQLDALNTYSKLLPFLESDATKSVSTLFKMATLHEVLSQHSEVLSCYRRILAASEGADVPSDNIITMVAYLLRLKDNSIWNLLVKAFNLLPESDSKNEWRSKFISRGMAVFKASDPPDSGLHDNLVSESEQLLSTHPKLALLSLVQITLWDQVPRIHIYDPSNISIELPSNKREWCKQLQDILDEGSLDASGVGVACAGGGLLLLADRKWTEAQTLIEKGLAASSGVCELHLLSAMTHLRLHDYHGAESASHKGLKCVKSVPKSLVAIFQTKLKLCLLCAAVGVKDGEQAKALADEFSQVMSGDCHVTALVGKGYLTAGDLSKATEILRTLKGEAGRESLSLTLQGELSLSSAQCEDAVQLFSEALKLSPTSPSLHFLHGVAVWRSKVKDKKPAYSSFIQAGKLDPHNGEVFYYLGLYQKTVNKNTGRAVKCFQKAVDLMPLLTEAAMELGDLLTASGEEEKAFEVYEKICSDVPPDKAKHAWLRTGLHHQSKGRYNEAIKCFQTYLRVDKSNIQCWECLGDAYLSRGSPNSALKAFNKCLELEPSSLYCLYQLAGIKQALGQLREAVTEYTAVLDMDSSYVPALKGRGESHLSLARQALADNLDSNAVDHISLALRDLACAAHQRPTFVCLWKLIGDSCSCLHSLPPGVARPSVPVVLQGQSSSYVGDCAEISKKELLKIGIRAYVQALRLNSDSAYCWHDLALCYCYLSRESEGDEKQTLLDTALRTAKKAVSEAPHNHLYWNTLGLIAADSSVGDVGLVQHCFIRSLQETNNAMAWSNLGALYFKQGNIKLAHQAFSNAQSACPDQTEAWVGQALVAESIGDSEAMDLFRHSTLLSYHPEGALGYGYWVCNTLHTINPSLILSPGGRNLNATATTAMLQARDTLEKCVRRVEGNSCAFNYLGLLLEQEGLTRRAERSYKRALEVGAGQNENAVRFNLARVLCENGSPDEAVSELTHLSQSDPLVSLQLALALGRAGKWTDSFRVYQSLVADGEAGRAGDDKSAVFIAQAMVAFASGDRANCKSLLFKSFQCSPVCAHGLVAMCALGCLDNDLTLLQAALQEIIKLLDSGTDLCLHPSCITVLNTIAHTLRENPEASECVTVIDVVTSRLTVAETHALPAPHPLMLHTMFASVATPEQILNLVQKILHAYPTQEWCSSFLFKHNEQLSV